MPVPAPPDDEALVAAAVAGERGALEQLLRDHYHRIYSVCRRVTGSDADGEDAAQEALVSIVRGISGYTSASQFSTWVYRVAVNASLDELRRRRRRPDPAPDSELADRRVPAAAGEGTAMPFAERVAARVDIDAALTRLAPEFRAAVVLRDLCGLDYAEIGDVLGVPPGTVRSRIARGRAALAGWLAPAPGAGKGSAGSAGSERGGGPAGSAGGLAP
jgi:RNA polymerase sigma-70 factor (ECF subfamily)